MVSERIVVNRGVNLTSIVRITIDGAAVYREKRLPRASLF